MTINLHLPNKNHALKPAITVIGVGGAGGNAVNNMIAADLEGVSFIIANTDAQALESSLTERTVQLGMTVTQGLGAGASPEVGRAAAEEALDEIQGHIQGANMVFITAGMGGGTGTGGAPVIARLAREQGILTVGVVTKPFHFEGAHRMKLAENGLDELQKYVDTMIVIPNQNLFRIANERTTFADAFRMADEVLHSGVRGVTDLMVMPGLINLDFNDIRTVMREMGKAMMGTGEAEGDKRAVQAAEAAISNPLLDDVSMKGAKGVLINVTGGPDMTLFEVDEAANRIRDEVDPDANIIFGSTFNGSMEGRMRVSVVATGIDACESMREANDEAHRPLSAAARKFTMGYRTAPEVARESTRTVAEQKAAEPRPYVELQRRANEALQKEKQPQPQPQQAMAQPVQQGLQFGETSAAQAAVQADTGFVFRRVEPALSAVGNRNVAVGGGGGDVDVIASGGFISPLPEQSSQRIRPVHEEEASERFRATALAVAKDPNATREVGKESASAKGFLQKVKGALASRTEETAESRKVEIVEKPKAEIRESKITTEEEYLDIPAFLRRQAN